MRRQHAPRPSSQSPAADRKSAALPAGENRSRRFVGWRLWALRGLLVVAAPLLLLVLAEGLLRLIGSGFDSSFFVPASRSAALTTNPRFGWRFASPTLAPRPQPLQMAAPKPKGVLRIFILGESAAQGLPDPAHGFSRIVECMLAERHPGAQFEVVNVAMTAINSHIVRLIAKECLQHEPDALVVYMGNNEVIGPYGPATVFQSFSPSLRLIRGSLWATSLRSGQWLASITRPSASAGQPEVWQGLATFARARSAPDDPPREVVYENFKANLADILAFARRSQTPAVVATVAVNLRDCPPFASLHRSGLSAAELERWQQHYDAGAASELGGDFAAAVAAYEAAANVDDGFADLHFRRARCEAALLQFDVALDKYRLARDRDALQLRTDERLNSIIRELADERASDGVYLADVERAFEKSELSPHGIPGEELFWEHVHLRFAGDYLVAQTLLPQIEAALAGKLSGAPSGEVPSLDACRRQLALTPWDESRLRGEILPMLGSPPFTEQLDHSERLAKFRRDVEQMVVDAPASEASEKIYLAALEQRPKDWHLRLNFSRLCQERGQLDSAREQIGAVLKLQPDFDGVRVLLANLDLSAGRLDRAESQYRQVLAADEFAAAALKGLADVLVARGQLAPAISMYRRAIELRPRYLTAYNNLGIALLGQGNTAAAAEQFEQVLAIAPDADAHLYLGNLLGKQGRLADAVEHYREACRLRPTLVAAHHNLGAALLATHEEQSALAAFVETARLDPAHVKAQTSAADILLRQGNSVAAIAHLRQAVTAGARDPQLLARLASLLAGDPDPDRRNGREAVRLAGEACRLAPGEPSAWEALSAANAEVGNYAEASRAAATGAAAADRQGQRELAQQLRDRQVLLQSRGSRP